MGYLVVQKANKDMVASDEVLVSGLRLDVVDLIWDLRDQAYEQLLFKLLPCQLVTISYILGRELACGHLPVVIRPALRTRLRTLQYRPPSS